MKKFLLRVVVPILCVIAIVGLDQLTKELILKNLSEGEFIPIIKNVLELTFVPNEGMIWGMMQGKQWLFVIITPIAVALVSWLYYFLPFERKFLPVRAELIMIVGGAIGNFYDRCFRGETFGSGYVVDMIYFKLIDFPVFNVADSFITVAVFAMIICVLFLYKEEDFDRVFGSDRNKKKQIEDTKEQTEENENN